MNDPGANQPFGSQDPTAGQQAGWPGGYQQPGPAAPGQPFPAMQPGGMYQPQPGNEALMSGEPVMVTIGDISVTSTTVYTPSGSRPLSEVTWTFTDMSVTSQGIPTWAIVCAIVFFVFCFLGLLFLLVKEDKTQGSVQVTVHGPGFLHTSTIPVASLAQVSDINARVNYVRTLTASFPSAPQPGAVGQAPADPQGLTAQSWQQTAQPGDAGQPWQQQAQSGSAGQAWPQAQPGTAGQPWQQNQAGTAGQPWLQDEQGQGGQQDQQPGQSW
jgi:hypothetical protein